MTICLGLRRIQAATRRAEAVKARSDTRIWVMDRRARTRHLIELGGLVEKSGLYAALGDDDPDAALLGVLMMLRDGLASKTDARGEPIKGDPIIAWRRRGKRALRGTDGSDGSS